MCFCDAEMHDHDTALRNTERAIANKLGITDRRGQQVPARGMIFKRTVREKPKRVAVLAAEQLDGVKERAR